MSEATAADYGRALEKGVSWLRFEPLIEAEFRHSHALRVRMQARLWQLFQLGVGLVGIQVILVGAAGRGARMFLFGCLAIHLAVSAVLAWTALGPAYARSYLRLAAILTPARACAFAVIVAAIISAGGTGTAAMTVNLFGLLFFSGLLLRQALLAAVAMTAAFAVALAAYGVPAALATYSVTSLLLVLGLAGFVAWDTQRSARQAFLEHGLTRADATRDALTGLVNRRHFDARLAALWKSCDEAREPITVLLIDVDHFKAYNDTYGHQAGDETLRKVAQALKAAAGSRDVVARFGGEEMALLATGLGEHEAEALATRLRRAIEELGIAHSGSADFGCVTASVGGACIVPQQGRSAAGALQLADENLYSAKRQGRNCVVFRSERYAMMQTGVFTKTGAIRR